MKKFILFFKVCLSFFVLYACQGAPEIPNHFHIKSARYLWGNNASAIDTISFQLQVNKINDTLTNYLYYKEDEFTKQKRIMIDIDARHDSIFLLKVGDYSPNITRIVQDRKKFYAGSKEVEVLKLKREVSGEGLNDVIFMTKEFGIVNMQSYDRKAKVLYYIASDKISANILKEINIFLENDKTGFYYPLEKK